MSHDFHFHFGHFVFKIYLQTRRSTSIVKFNPKLEYKKHVSWNIKFPTIVQCFAMGTILPVSQNENCRFHSSVRKALFGFSGKCLMENGAETFIFPVCTFNLLNYGRFLSYDREYNLCGAMYDTFHCPKSAIVHSWITPCLFSVCYCCSWMLMLFV